ncbi:SLAP2 protein, partial [Psilopogon haemacephalus]|nr:SLAP2 protein [Psilopogon haemacephalus]
ALALCDFPSSAGAAAVLRMGEQLHVLSEDGEWWLVASEASGKQCHVPSSCVAKVHRWLDEGISRQKTEELLLRPGNRSATFLIRESQSRPGCCSPSVRHGAGGGWHSVRRYRIQRLHTGWVQIAPSLTFPSLHRLGQHYSGRAGEGARAPQAAPAEGRPRALCSLSHSSFLAAAAPQDEDSPISPGLRESISSYLLLADSDAPRAGPCRAESREA